MFYCTSCAEGAYVDNGECHPCSASCKTCEYDEDACTSCEEFYTLSELEYTCVENVAISGGVRLDLFNDANVVPLNFYITSANADGLITS